MSNANLTLHDKLNTIEFFVMLTVSFAVGGLALFNALIISNGSTNIEIKSINLPFLKSNQVKYLIKNFISLIRNLNVC